MYKIGEFSKICKTTVKTLRHYEELGLLTPEQVDEWTGYRYYSAAQLARMDKIIRFREMGFTLEEVRRALTGRPDPQTLAAKEAELKARAEDCVKKLRNLTNYIEQCKGESIMEKEQIKSLPQVIVASYRKVIKGYDELFHLNCEVIGPEMGRLGCTCRDPEYSFNLYHDGEYRDHDIDVEICNAVTECKPDSDIIKFKTVPAVDTAVCLYHRGPYDILGATYAQVFGYIEKNGYEIVGLPRESYIDGIWNKDSEADWLTEIQVPVRKK